MAIAKVVRRRSRRARAVTGSKGASRTRKLSVRRQRQRFSPELHAPMTAEVEGQLRKLVAGFGEDKVCEVVDPLTTKCKLNDWQCVVTVIRRIAREKQRETSG
jgi:hypothetical protein